MSPEQAAGDQQLDHRSDLFSAALVMWEMLAGHHPFVGRAPHEMVSAHAVRVVPSPIDLRPAIPVALAALVQQCLAKNPGDRPPSADEILTALEVVPVTDPGRTVDARVLSDAGSSRTVERRPARANACRVRHPRRRHRLRGLQVSYPRLDGCSESGIHRASSGGSRRRQRCSAR
jgi:serine/threonine-protein kinase